jgi:hypothetical protein
MRQRYSDIPARMRRDMTMPEIHEHLRRPTRRRFLQGALATAGAVAVGPTVWIKPGWAAVAPHAPRLSYGLDPTSDMSVVWSTPEPVANPRLLLGAGSEQRLVPADTRAVGGLLGTADEIHHHVRLTDLAPDTTYPYAIAHDGGVLDGLHLTTAALGGAFTFTAFGDQGVTSAAAAISALIAGIDPAFHLVAGDLCYANGTGTGLVVDLADFDPAEWQAWFSQNQASMARIPWMPAVGNHDMEPGLGLRGYDGHAARLALPHGFNEVVYSFRRGNVAIIALDANDISEEIPSNAGYTLGGQTAWLDQQLAAARQDPAVDFIVAYFHHCAYCTMDSHGSDGGVRARWVPLFDRHQVDLVINGHNHGYERTHPIQGNAPTTEAPAGATVRPADHGTTYVCAGGGGRSPNEFVDQAFISHGPAAHELGIDAELEDSPWSAVRAANNSFLRVDVTPSGADGVTTMRLAAIDHTGHVFDRVTLQRTRASVVTPPAPTQPAPPTVPSTPAAPSPSPTGADQLPATGRADHAVPAMLAGAAAVATLAATRAARD